MAQIDDRSIVLITALSQLSLFCLHLEQFLFPGHLHTIYLVGHSCLMVLFKRPASQTDFLFRHGKRQENKVKIHFFQYKVYLRLFWSSDFDKISIAISLQKYLTPIQIS